MALDTKEPIGGNYGRIDPRQIEDFMRVPGFVQTVTEDQYGRMSERLATRKWTSAERIVYDAVAEGYTSMDSLPVATGLPETEINTALTSLVNKGFLTSSVSEVK